MGSSAVAGSPAGDPGLVVAGEGCEAGTSALIGRSLATAERYTPSVGWLVS